MKPQFTTPCYVRVEDADKREEIYHQLKQIGYEMSELTRKLLEKIPEFWQISTSPRSRQIHVTSELGAVHKVVGRVDCGTNTDLFLALAGMRSDTAKGQWFVIQGSVVNYDECNNKIQKYIRNGWAKYATISEIIEHFKTKTK